jgi:hypothetical protein
MGRKIELGIGAGEENRTLVISLEGYAPREEYQDQLIHFGGRKPGSC